MHPERRRLLMLNVLGGIAVLGSYAWGLTSHPSPGEALWGNVPESWRGLYTVGMFAATFGYFAFAQFLFMACDPATVKFGRSGYGALKWVFAAILLPSAVWLPMTLAYAAEPSAGLWLAIRAVLAVVGLGSIALIGMLVRATPRQPSWSWTAAVFGSVAFAFQTALLDALVWTHCYR